MFLCYNEEMKNIAVIGGGASGAIAAIVAADRGTNVTLYESSDRVLKKVSATGGGRCNLTNMNQAAVIEKFCENYNNIGFASRIIRKFTPLDTIRFFHDIGVETDEIDGWVYPRTFHSASVVNSLLLELKRKGVVIRLSTPVRTVESSGGKVMVNTHGIYDSVVIATGSPAGCLGRYGMISEIKPISLPFAPTLCPVYTDESVIRPSSGLRARAKVSLLKDGGCIAEECGEVQFNRDYVGGIVILQMTSYIAGEEGSFDLMFDFAEDFTLEELIENLSRRAKQRLQFEVSELLTGFFHKYLGATVLKRANIDASMPMSELVEEDIYRIAINLKSYKLPVQALSSLNNAQAARGGIDVLRLNDDLKIASMPRVYAAGEAVDIDGRCGGYNLQWAWSSGYVAGCSASEGR